MLFYFRCYRHKLKRLTILFCECILLVKENNYIELDDASSCLELCLSVTRMTNQYRFSSLNENFDEAISDEYLRKYQISLTLEDEGNELAQIAFLDIRMVPISSSFGAIEDIIDENQDSNDTIEELLGLKEIDMSLEADRP